MCRPMQIFYFAREASLSLSLSLSMKIHYCKTLVLKISAPLSVCQGERLNFRSASSLFHPLAPHSRRADLFRVDVVAVVVNFPLCTTTAASFTDTDASFLFLFFFFFFFLIALH